MSFHIENMCFLDSSSKTSIFRLSSSFLWKHLIKGIFVRVIALGAKELRCSLLAIAEQGFFLPIAAQLRENGAGCFSKMAPPFILKGSHIWCSSNYWASLPQLFWFMSPTVSMSPRTSFRPKHRNTLFFTTFFISTTNRLSSAKFGVCTELMHQVLLR